MQILMQILQFSFRKELLLCSKQCKDKNYEQNKFEAAERKGNVAISRSQVNGFLA